MDGSDGRPASQTVHPPETDRPEAEIRTGIQLHTLSDLDATLPETIRRVGEAGLDGVEFAGTLADEDLDAVRSALEDADVEAVAAHVDWPTLQDGLDDVVETYTALGCRRLVNPHLGIGDVVSDRAVRDTADRLARMGARLAERDIEFYYHNAPHDMRPTFRHDRLGALLALGPMPALVGEPATQLLNTVTRTNARTIESTAVGQIYRRTVDRSLRFEIDVGSVAMAGYDPEAVLDFVGDKLDIVHHTPEVNAAATMRAARRNDVEWVVYEDDHPDDPAAALRRAAETLVE